MSLYYFMRKKGRISPLLNEVKVGDECPYIVDDMLCRKRKENTFFRFLLFVILCDI